MTSFNFAASNFSAAGRQTLDIFDRTSTEMRTSSKRFGRNISISCKVRRSSRSGPQYRPHADKFFNIKLCHIDSPRPGKSTTSIEKRFPHAGTAADPSHTSARRTPGNSSARDSRFGSACGENLILDHKDGGFCSPRLYGFERGRQCHGVRFWYQERILVHHRCQFLQLDRVAQHDLALPRSQTCHCEPPEANGGRQYRPSAADI
jgi:hypothetical protein